MTIPVSAWICLAACAVVLIEIIILTVLYLKLSKKKKASGKETLYAAAGAATLPAFFEPFFTVCSILLVIEAVFYLWLIIHFARLLKAKDEAEETPAEPESEPEPEPEPEPQPVEIDETVPVAEVQELVRDTITMAEAREALSDEFALHLIEEAPVVAAVAAAADDGADDGADDDADKNYKNKTIINVDTLSENYQSGEHVNLETMKEKGLIPKKIDFVKVLGRGILDKHLVVEAQDFSADAVKMIVLTGGHAIRKK